MASRFSRKFNPLSALELLSALDNPSDDLTRYLGGEIYVNEDKTYLQAQKDRLRSTLREHIKRFGEERPTILLRAPGRLNAFLEYLDMCSGDHMSTTIDGDIPLAVSARTDDILDVFNINPLFSAQRLSLSEEFNRFATAPWADRALAGMEDNWDNRSLLFPHYGREQGDWTNYILSPYMRAMFENSELTLRGADMTFGPATTPFRAGVSSSSAMVVLSFLAMLYVNAEHLPSWNEGEVCSFLGEAEWYVGTHGGANDQMTILLNPANSVSYNRHSRRDPVATPLPFLEGVHVVLANSLWEVNKTGEGNQSFNMRKCWMQMGDSLLRRIITSANKVTVAGHSGSSDWLPRLTKEITGFSPGAATPRLESESNLWKTIAKNYHEIGSLHEDILGVPNEVIEELISLLPVKVRPVEAAEIFNTDLSSIERRHTKPKREIGGYHLRTTARFFHRQNVIGRRLERIFLEADERLKSGELTSSSPDYDQYRRETGGLIDTLQDALTFDFRVSNPQLDLLLSIAKRGPGYLGGKLTGAGKGGCVSILARAEKSQALCDFLDKAYYGKSERFEYYRMVLQDEFRFSEPDSPERKSAKERLNNLDKALSSITNQRRVVTFSRGASALDLVGLA